MKVLIWTGCIFISALVMTLFKMSGIILGGIPTALLYLAATALAQSLCKLWDEHKLKKKNRKREEIFQKKIYCKECGQRIFPSDKFCDKCGTKVTENLLNNGKFCYKCGANITHDNNNCHICFAKIELEEQ